MIDYLKWYYGHAKAVEIGELLIDLGYGVLKRDGTPDTNDSACWGDWSNAVSRVLTKTR